MSKGNKQAFRIEGDFQMGRARQHFAMQLVGSDEDDARDHLYKELGSRHGVKRRHVTIESIQAVTGDAVNPVTRKRIEKA